MKSVKEEVLGVITELSQDTNYNIKKKEQITVGDKINELGFDSISFIKLVVELENRLGIEFEDTMLDYKSIDTVADLINLIENIGNVGFSRFAGHSV